MVEKRVFVNERIRASTVRLIGADGSQLGIVPLEEALDAARDSGMDLVEVAPDSNPPVCRIMDYGRYKYTQAKKSQEARRKSSQVTVKEIKIRPKTEDHDLQVKLRMARKFLEEGNRLKLTIRFRGREMAYAEKGRDKLVWFAQQLQELGQVETMPRMEHRQLTLVLAPKPSQ